MIDRYYLMQYLYNQIEREKQLLRQNKRQKRSIQIVFQNVLYYFPSLSATNKAHTCKKI